LYCAVEKLDKLKSGEYYSDCAVKEKNRLAVGKLGEENSEKLWKVSEQLIAQKVPEARLLY